MISQVFRGLQGWCSMALPICVSSSFLLMILPLSYAFLVFFFLVFLIGPLLSALNSLDTLHFFLCLLDPLLSPLLLCKIWKRQGLDVFFPATYCSSTLVE